jgi:5-formyltetrahydrofolate cyclo-ligase
VQTKGEWRRWARSLPPAGDAESAAVVAHLAPWLLTRPPVSVLTYLPLAGEVSLVALADRVPAVRWLVTRTPQEGPLTVHRLSAQREVHPYGFEQPRADAEAVDPAEVEVVLVPGLAFDRSGHRLGRGAGYYDELLARLPVGSIKVGVTVTARVVPALPHEPHDVAMDRLATEEGCGAVMAGGRAR